MCRNSHFWPSTTAPSIVNDFEECYKYICRFIRFLSQIHYLKTFIRSNSIEKRWELVKISVWEHPDVFIFFEVRHIYAWGSFLKESTFLHDISLTHRLSLTISWILLPLISDCWLFSLIQPDCCCNVIQLFVNLFCRISHSNQRLRPQNFAWLNLLKHTNKICS